MIIYEAKGEKQDHVIIQVKMSLFLDKTKPWTIHAMISLNVGFRP